MEGVHANLVLITQAMKSPEHPSSPVLQMAYLALKQSKLLRRANSNLGYAAQLFK